MLWKHFSVLYHYFWTWWMKCRQFESRNLMHFGLERSNGGQRKKIEDTLELIYNTDLKQLVNKKKFIVAKLHSGNAKLFHKIKISIIIQEEQSLFISWLLVAWLQIPFFLLLLWKSKHHNNFCLTTFIDILKGKQIVFTWQYKYTRHVVYPSSLVIPHSI